MDEFGVEFVSLSELVQTADIISVNVPNTPGTYRLINREIISAMKDDCIFISIAREQVVDIPALLEKAKNNPSFYTILDIDVLPDYVGKNGAPNIIITPHIAGGTIETRKRMFREAAESVAKMRR